jgi:O-antigen/teichoic acid export membrane protein
MHRLAKKGRALLSEKTSHHILINAAGNVSNFVLSGIVTVLLARVFPPSTFGTLSILLVISYLLANVLSFGFPATIYAHVPTLRKDRHLTLRFLMTQFLTLCGLSTGVLVLLLGAVPFINQQIVKTEVPLIFYITAFVGTELFLWNNFLRDCLNALGKFTQNTQAIVISNLTKMLLLVILYSLQMISIQSVQITLIIIGPLVAIGYILLTQSHIVRSLRLSLFDPSHLKVAYTASYFISTQLFYLATRIDVFLIAYFMTQESVGYYSLAQRIILSIVTVSDSVTQVLSPLFAKSTNSKQLHATMRKGLAYMSLPTLAFLGAILCPDFIYHFVFGRRYDAAIPLTRMLSAGYIIYSYLALAVLFFLYTIKKAGHLIIVNGTILAVVASVCWILIPKVGLLGAPIAYVLAFLAAGLYTIGAWRHEYGKRFRPRS